MTGFELVELFQRGARRFHVVGNLGNGVVAGLDLEGRLFAILNGEVVSKVNPEAILGEADSDTYQNPGGDGLWPAPEGTVFGYEYASGKWRVPPGVTGAQYKVAEKGEGYAKIRAEVDLINNRGLGIPTVFERAVRVSSDIGGGLTVRVMESIQYIGCTVLQKGQFSLAPWTLCQFDSGLKTEVTFNDVPASSFWDLYALSRDKQYRQDGVWHTRTEGGQEYIDIIDAPPDQMPSARGIRFSVYCDPGLFMEIEACGGCPETLIPECIMRVEVKTEYTAL